MNIKKGFTLIEILVSLAIVAVLGATTIPSMMGFIDDRKAKECEIIRDEIVKMYIVFRDSGDIKPTREDLESVIVSNWGVDPCPSGGKYALDVIDGADSGGISVGIECSIQGHGRTAREGLYLRAEALFKKYLDIINNKSINTAKQAELLRALFDEMGTGYPAIGNEILRNDHFRWYLFKQNGGKWEDLDPKINENVTKDKLYVNAYINKEGDIFIYANQSGDGSGRPWAANAIYNPDDGYWYKPKAGTKPSYTELSGLDGTKDAWEKVKAQLETEWEKVEL